MRRVRQIAAAAAPPALVPGAVAGGASITELEGEAIGRYASVKVALLGFGERGVPLASKDEVAKVFTQRSLEPVWVESEAEIPADTAVIVTTGAPVTAETLAKAPKLKLVAVAFSGVDHVDSAACRAKGVAVVNVPGYSTEATAELVLGFVLSHLRRLPQCFQVIKNGQWSCPQQDDLQSKTIGLVGVGRIGMRLAEIFAAFKVKNVLGYSLKQEKEFTDMGGTYVGSLASLFLEADVVCVCVPLAPNTEGLVSETLMNLMRPNCLLVNVSRGGVVDEEALVKYLKEERFSAALDVFGKEPLPKDDPLRTVPEERLMMTPHVGYQTSTSLAKRLDSTVKNILAYLAGQPVNNAL